MPASQKSSSSKGRSKAVIRLPADLDIEGAAALQQQLLTHVDDEQSVTLDGREVTRVHTAALQMFCMFFQDRRNAGREVCWRQPSEPLRGAAALLGLSTLMQLSREHT